MKPRTFLLLHMGQSLALLTTTHALLKFIIPKELAIASDHTIEWIGRPSLGTSEQQVVLFKNDEAILTLCEGVISGSGQCSFRLEEKDVNTIDRRNYGYYSGLQALDGVTLDRSRDFTIQYEEDPAEARLRNGAADYDEEAGEEGEEEVEEEDSEPRDDGHHNDHSKKKDRDMKKHKESKRKAKAKEEDDDDDHDHGDGDGVDDEDLKNDEDEGGYDEDRYDDEDSTDEAFEIGMDMDVDTDEDNATWNRPGFRFGLPYPEISAADSRSNDPLPETDAGARAIHANAAIVSSGFQRAHTAIQHAPVGITPNTNNDIIHPRSAAPLSVPATQVKKDPKRIHRA